MANQTFKFKIANSIYKKNFEAASYRLALIDAKEWRKNLVAEGKATGKLTPVN